MLTVELGLSSVLLGTDGKGKGNYAAYENIMYLRICEKP